MKKYDVVALGELLIDFTENGKSNQGNPLFEANLGGAPCNVLAMLTKLGHKTAFIGKVGEDFFGEQLRDAITEVGIDADGLCTDKEIHTVLQKNPVQLFLSIRIYDHHFGILWMRRRNRYYMALSIVIS